MNQDTPRITRSDNKPTKTIQEQQQTKTDNNQQTTEQREPATTTMEKDKRDVKKSGLSDLRSFFERKPLERAANTCARDNKLTIGVARLTQPPNSSSATGDATEGISKTKPVYLPQGRDAAKGLEK